MKKKGKKRIQNLAIAGVLLALILVFLLVPIPSASGVSYAVIALIAVIIGCQFNGLLMGLFCGLSFGLASLLGSFTTGAGSLLAPAFHNPLISVLPRVIVPITCYFSYIGLRKLFKLCFARTKKYNEKVANHFSIIISSGISAAIAVITNTALVMTLIYAFHSGDVFGGTEIGTAFLWTITITNAPLEIAVCAPVAPAVLIALKATFHEFNDKYSIKLPLWKNEIILSSESQIAGDSQETINIERENETNLLDNPIDNEQNNLVENNIVAETENVDNESEEVTVENSNDESENKREITDIDSDID